MTRNRRRASVFTVSRSNHGRMANAVTNIKRRCPTLSGVDQIDTLWTARPSDAGQHANRLTRLPWRVLGQVGDVQRLQRFAQFILARVPEVTQAHD
jgi:hypothetical protein